jgi:hypothetical protein
MPSEYDDAIRRCIDEQVEMERKAAAWDTLRAFAERTGLIGLVAQMDSFVHPAPSTKPE